MKILSSGAKSRTYSEGFTLIELMISLSLGLGLMTLMTATMLRLSEVSRGSAEAAEAMERGYFLMDVMEAWVGEAGPIRVTDQVSESEGAHDDGESMQDALSSVMTTGTTSIFNPCQNPIASPLPDDSHGLVVLSDLTVDCIPQRHRQLGSPALFLERRFRCWGNCTHQGFYALTDSCSAESKASSTNIVWLESASRRPPCFENGGAVRLNRALIYVRDYAWDAGDGESAVMFRELADEPESRWLRSAMLAHDIRDWQLQCLRACKTLVNGNVSAQGVGLRFSIPSRGRPIRIQRVLTAMHP